MKNIVVTVGVEVTPQELAASFASMDSDEMSVFFNALATNIETWERGMHGFEMQMLVLKDSKELSKAGWAVLKTIGDCMTD